MDDVLPLWLRIDRDQETFCFYAPTEASGRWVQIFVAETDIIVWNRFLNSNVALAVRFALALHESLEKSEGMNMLPASW